MHFKSLTDVIDTSTPSGRFFFHVMASLSQMERELTIERTQAGLAVARKLGRIGGHRRLMTDSKIESARKLLNSGVPPERCCRYFQAARDRCHSRTELWEKRRGLFNHCLIDDWETFYTAMIWGRKASRLEVVYDNSG